MLRTNLTWLTLILVLGVLPVVLGDITVGGDRPVVVKVPSNYDAEVPTPLVIELHGYRSAPASSDSSRWALHQLAEEEGFLFAGPSGELNPAGRYYWDATDACCANFGPGTPVDDSGYLRRVIQETVENLNVDRDFRCPRRR